MSKLYDIDLEQDVFFDGHKFHSKGDKHLATEQYKADLDAIGVKYKVVLEIPTEVFRAMCTKWRKAMESLGYKYPFSKVSKKTQRKAWDIVAKQKD